MARASKTPASEVKKAVSDKSADAASNTLQQALNAAHGPGKVEGAVTVAKLAAMCEEAADHMAKAQSVLFDGKEGGEMAIDHLDAALQCLNTLANEGERYNSEQGSKAQSA